MSLNAVS
jgi:hypothetical protein